MSTSLTIGISLIAQRGRGHGVALISLDFTGWPLTVAPLTAWPADQSVTLAVAGKAPGGASADVPATLTSAGSLSPDDEAEWDAALLASGHEAGGSDRVPVTFTALDDDGEPVFVRLTDVAGVNVIPIFTGALPGVTAGTTASAIIAGLPAPQITEPGVPPIDDGDLTDAIRVGGESVSGAYVIQAGEVVTRVTSLAAHPTGAQDVISAASIASVEPTAVADADWSAAENADAAGRIDVTVAGTVVVPEGFVLRWYAGADNPPSDAQILAGRTILPGETLTTNTTFPVGETRYVQLAFERLSDAAILARSSVETVVLAGAPPVGVTYAMGSLQRAAKGGVPAPAGATAITGGNTGGAYQLSGGLVSPATNGSAIATTLSFDAGDDIEMTLDAGRVLYLSPSDGADAIWSEHLYCANNLMGDGDVTIKLRAGDYGEASSINLGTRNYSNRITIAAASLSDKPQVDARLSSNTMTVGRVTLRGLDFFRETGPRFFNPAGASNFTNWIIEDCLFRGVEIASDDVRLETGWPGPAGVTIRGTDIVIRRCRFLNLTAMLNMTSKGGSLTLVDNEFDNYWSDCINISTGNTVDFGTELIARNYVGHPLMPASFAASAGAHIDFIQFLTSLRDAQIENNVFVLGTTLNENAQVVFSNFGLAAGLIRGNIIFSDTNHGITFEGGTGGAVRCVNNLVVGRDASAPGTAKPRIAFGKSGKSYAGIVGAYGNVGHGALQFTPTSGVGVSDPRNNDMSLGGATASGGLTELSTGGWLPDSLEEALHIAQIVSGGRFAAVADGGLGDPVSRGPGGGYVTYPDLEDWFTEAAEAATINDDAWETYTPLVIASGQWSMANDGGTITVTIAGRKDASPLTSIEYRVNGGSEITLGALTGDGAATITATVGDAVEVRGVNAAGAGPWSASKAAPASSSAEPVLSYAAADGVTYPVAGAGTGTTRTIALPTMTLAAGQRAALVVRVVGSSPNITSVTITGHTAAVIASTPSGVGQRLWLIEVTAGAGGISGSVTLTINMNGSSAVNLDHRAIFDEGFGVVSSASSGSAGVSSRSATISASGGNRVIGASWSERPGDNATGVAWTNDDAITMTEVGDYGVTSARRLSLAHFSATGSASVTVTPAPAASDHLITIIVFAAGPV